MNLRLLTDRATQFKTTAQYVLSSKPVQQHMQRLEDENLSGNGWWAPTHQAYVKATNLIFERSKCVASTVDATTLLDHAAKSLLDDIPVFDMTPEMPDGFLYLEHPLSSAGDEVVAYLWGTDYGVAAETLKPTTIPVLMIATLGSNWEFGVKNWRIDPHLTLTDLNERMTFSNPTQREGAIYDLRLVIAFNLLLAQGVTLNSEHHASRQLRRQVERKLGKVLDPVTIIRLPHRHYAHSNGESSVDWSHRWVVSGHWRKQWYPAAEVHRPKWIAPYIKGPDDLPLVIKEKRYVFDMGQG